MKNKKNSKIWLIYKEDLRPDENKPEPEPENPTKEEDSSNLNKKFKFELTKSNTWKIAKYIGNDYRVTIPREYQGKNITEIGNRAFFNSVIQSVTIEGSVKEIGESAFSVCTNLEEAILNEGLEKNWRRGIFSYKHWIYYCTAVSKRNRRRCVFRLQKP